MFKEIKNSEETKQASKLDSDMTPILELPDKEFKITTIDMLNSPMEKKKANTMQKQMININRDK